MALAPALGSILVARGGLAGAPAAKRTRHWRLCRRRPAAAVALARGAVVDLTGNDSSDDSDGGAVVAASGPSIAGATGGGGDGGLVDLVGDGRDHHLDSDKQLRKSQLPTLKMELADAGGRSGREPQRRRGKRDKAFAPAAIFKNTQVKTVKTEVANAGGRSQRRGKRTKVFAPTAMFNSTPSSKQHRKSHSPPVKMEVANDETRPSARLSAFRSVFHWQQQS